IIFCAENAAVVLLRVTGVQWYKPHYRSPLYPWMQGFGIISGLVLLYELGMIVVPAITSIGLLGTLLFVGFGRYRVARQGVIRLYGRRVTLLLRSSLVRSDKRHPPRSESTSVHTYFSPAEFESTTVDDSDEDHAAVVVPLFGKERSPEMLVEVGAALADGEKVEVVHVTELPEQTVLTALSDDDIVVESLHRRIQTMASREQFTAEFEAVVTHDLIKTVSDINTRTHANWLVIEWKGSSTHGVFFHNPVGWLISNLTCNLALLKDAGVRYIRRILVFCEPGPDERLVASTADHLATIYQAELTFVGVLSEDHQTQERENLESYLQDVKQRCDSNSESVVLIGNDRIRTIVNISAGFDLLVAGSPRRPNLKERLKSSLFGIRTDELTARSACSVLRLRTPRPQSYPESTYTGKVL
ncbi:MAG: universal stress protein, partial [Bdellovibrionales bacterium]|nr:universal stress protein [Bdellovibrionales bacterium]